MNKGQLELLVKELAEIHNSLILAIDETSGARSAVMVYLANNKLAEVVNVLQDHLLKEEL